MYYYFLPRPGQNMLKEISVFCVCNTIYYAVFIRLLFIHIVYRETNIYHFWLKAMFEYAIFRRYSQFSTLRTATPIHPAPYQNGHDLLNSIK